MNIKQKKFINYNARVYKLAIHDNILLVTKGNPKILSKTQKCVSVYPNILNLLTRKKVTAQTNRSFSSIKIAAFLLFKCDPE